MYTKLYRSPYQSGRFDRPPIGNRVVRLEWSRDRWLYITLTGQGRDPKRWSLISRQQHKVQ